MNKFTQVALVIVVIAFGGILALDKINDFRAANNQSVNEKFDKIMEKLDKIVSEKDNHCHGSIGQVGPGE